MIRHRASCFVLVAITSLLTLETPAFAGDPAKIGKHVQDMVQPNAKSLWICALVIGCIVTVFGKIKPGLIAAFYGAILFSGAIIYNPNGFGEMANSVGQKLF